MIDEKKEHISQHKHILYLYDRKFSVDKKAIFAVKKYFIRKFHPKHGTKNLSC